MSLSITAPCETTSETAQDGFNGSQHVSGGVASAWDAGMFQKVDILVMMMMMIMMIMTMTVMMVIMVMAIDDDGFVTMERTVACRRSGQ